LERFPIEIELISSLVSSQLSKEHYIMTKKRIKFSSILTNLAKKSKKLFLEVILFENDIENNH